MILGRRGGHKSKDGLPNHFTHLATAVVGFSDGFRPQRSHTPTCCYGKAVPPRSEGCWVCWWLLKPSVRCELHQNKHG